MNLNFSEEFLAWLWFFGSRKSMQLNSTSFLNLHKLWSNLYIIFYKSFKTIFYAWKPESVFVISFSCGFRLRCFCNFFLTFQFAGKYSELTPFITVNSEWMPLPGKHEAIKWPICWMCFISAMQKAIRWVRLQNKTQLSKVAQEAQPCLWEINQWSRRSPCATIILLVKKGAVVTKQVVLRQLCKVWLQIAAL